MKRKQRINRITRRRKQQNRLLPIVLILAAGALVLQLGVVGALVGAAGIGALNYYNSISSQGLARLRQAPEVQDVQPTRILDRNGKLLMEISDTSKGLHKNVPLSKIPIYMREAMIASENKTFYTDPGIDPARTLDAVVNDLLHRGNLSGASTITQQVVKRLVLNANQTPQRKLQEIMIALAVAKPGSGFSKDYILNLYLNSVFFGHEATGVEAAARVFFGKDVWQIDLAQSALLAGLVQEPSYYDPLGPYGPEPAKNRMLYVLDQMRKDGFISKARERQAIAEGQKFVFSFPHWQLTGSRSLAPYWTDWIQHLLTYSTSNNPDWYTDPTLAAVIAKAGGLTAGLTIRTTLDLNMYNQAQQIMNQKVSYLSGQNVKDAAVVVLDPRSAECLAMVGGLNYYSQESGSQINMAAHPRSPGSSFKAFTYLTAFEQGWSPSKIVLDTPQTWPDPSEPSGVYSPQNYDHTYYGAVTVRYALANSRNVPAVKTMAAVGIQNVIKTAESMGAWHLRSEEKGAGLSTTLGSLPVPLWQMAQAYNVFPNNGVFRPMQSVLSIKDADGTTLWSYKTPPGTQVAPPQDSYLMTSVLKDNYARVLAFGPNSQLHLGPDQNLTVNQPAAVKTGTSQDFRDNLTIGYTPHLLTATWVGNPDNTPMINVEGVDGAGPIWHDFMEWGLSYLKQPYADFTPPPGVVLARVSSTGYLADQRTAWPITDVFAAGAVPHLYDPGYGSDTYTEDRHYFNDFSIDGGTMDGLPAGPLAVTPVTGTTTLSTTVTGPNGSVPSGSSGILTQRPGDHANLCGGGYYTYAPVYINGQLRWKYTCQ